MFDSKSGTNEHPRRRFDTIICVSEFWASKLSFLTFKPCKYTPQSQLMSNNVSGKNSGPTHFFWKSIFLIPGGPGDLYFFGFRYF